METVNWLDVFGMVCNCKNTPLWNKKKIEIKLSATKIIVLYNSPKAKTPKKMKNIPGTYDLPDLLTTLTSQGIMGRFTKH